MQASRSAVLVAPSAVSREPRLKFSTLLLGIRFKLQHGLCCSAQRIGNFGTGVSPTLVELAACSGTGGRSAQNIDLQHEHINSASRASRCSSQAQAPWRAGGFGAAVDVAGA